MNPPTPPVIALHQLSLYNTGRMSSEQVIAAFAARRSVLERILADLAAEKPQSRAQHHLVVGQRGMGKTMLLARIAAELRTKPELTPRFIPLVFAEEQYAVDRLSKFWLNCLDSLADARELTKDLLAVDKIDATVKRLTAITTRPVKDDQPFADEVYAAFADAARATGQRPVLLVDNLQLVFERLEPPQQHSLRELLMRPGAPILVGASPSPPPATQDYGAAFYDHFKVHYLRPLDETEMRDLLVHLATAAQREDVRQRVLQHPARLKVLRLLTGGNPRTTLTLFFLYAEDFAPSVFGDLEGLLDRVTPLYKARFEELTPQQQVVTSAIANHWDPVTAATLAQNTALPAGTISAQLDRLEKTGVIERVELFGESRTGYQIAERFFNIWFLMRSASRRQRREVEFLTRFLESFYEPPDRSRLAKHLMGEDSFSPDRYLWSCAVAASLTEPELAGDLTRHNELLALREAAADARNRLRDLIDFSAIPPATLAFDQLRKKIISIVPADADVGPDDFAKEILGDRFMFRDGTRDYLASRSAPLEKPNCANLLSSVRCNAQIDALSFSEDSLSWLRHRLCTGQLSSPDNLSDWRRTFLSVPNRAELFTLLLQTIPSSVSRQLGQDVIERVKSLLIPTDSATATDWNNWAHFLHSKLDLPLEAEVAYRKAIELDGTFSWPWNNLGNLLKNCLNRVDEAESAYRHALSLEPDSIFALTGLANLLSQKNNGQEEAETLYRKAIALPPSIEVPAPWNGLGNLLCDALGRYDEAEDAFSRAMQLDPENDCPRHNLLFLWRDFLGELDHARPLLKGLTPPAKSDFPDSYHLQHALFAAYDSNWGLTRDLLSLALAQLPDGFRDPSGDDWLRASAVLIHLNYGAELVAFLDEQGTTARLRPWVEALRALQIGDRRALQNIAPEIRTTAEVFYDGIERRLLQLPASTRRRVMTKRGLKKR